MSAPGPGTTGPAPAAGIGQGALVILATTAVQILLSMSMLVLPAVAPRAAASLGVSSALIGAQISLLYGMAALTSLFAARLVRRFGAARTSQIGLACAAAGLVMASVPSLPLIATGSLVLGVAYGLPNPAAAALLTRFTSGARRNLVFSLKQTGVPLGGALAGLLAPPLAERLGWQAPLIATALAALMLAALLTPARPGWDDDRDPRHPVARLPTEGLRAVLAVAPLRWLLLVGALLAAVQLCLMAFTVVLLVEEFGFGAIAAGAALSAVQIAGAAGRIAWGGLADRLADSLGTLAGLGLAIAALALGVTLTPTGAPGALILLLLTALGATAIGWNGVFLAEVARLAPEGEVAQATSVLLAGTYFGVFLGPAAFAAALPLVGGYQAAFGLLAAAASAALACLVAARAGRPSPA